MERIAGKGAEDMDALPPDHACFRVTFFSADWTPWRALEQVRGRWPGLQVRVQAAYALD